MTQATPTQLERYLKELHLAAILQNYRQQAEEGTRANWPYETYLANLIEQEVERRSRNRRQRRIKEAHFPLLKELAHFDFEAAPLLNKQKVLELAKGEYMEQASPVIMVGGSGLGKTHIAIGLGLAACRQDRRVRFYTVTGLVNELHQAQDEHQLPKFLEKALRHQLVILDEFGYVPFSPMGAQLLFQFCSALHERVSMIITTNLPFAEWVQVLGDERLTSGLLDRVTFGSQILEFVGESYRLGQRMLEQREAESLRNACNAGDGP